MLFEKLHNVCEKFREKCPELPRVGELTFDAIKSRLDNILELNKELKSIENMYLFGSLEEEIKYYKFAKPEFTKYGIFYERLYSMELEKPIGSKNFYRSKLKELRSDSKNMAAEIEYFRTGNTVKDEVLFTRNSSKNHIFAVIKALLMLEKYLLDKDKKKSVEELIADFPQLKWTRSKTDLTDLCNLLKASKAINNGDISVAEIVKVFERIFNIDLGDHYRIFHESLNRKEAAKFPLELVNVIRKLQDDQIEREFKKHK